MFRKTIIRLAYSPALAGELAAYAKQLRREETKRQIGLIFVVLALVVQSFAVMFPPESANARNSADFIEGGFGTIDEYLGYYDQDAHGIKSLLASLGISRGDISAAHAAHLEPSPDLMLWKMTSRGDGGDSAYDFLKSDGTAKTAYYHPLNLSDSSELGPAAYVGSSLSAGWFALLKSSGNLVTKFANPNRCTAASELPAAMPLPVTLMDISQCGLKLAPTLSAHNLTSDMPGPARPAQASDRIIYTLAVKNNDNRTVSIPLALGLADILEYGQLIDKGGAHLDQETKTLSWAGNVSLPPDASVTRSFIVKVMPVIPSTAAGQNDATSYDCVMSSSFGETVRVPLACPLPKAVERIVNKLPLTSVHTNLLFAASLAAIAAYFYVRSRQLGIELRRIRHNHSGSL